jgi:hypothetical protein
MGRVPIYATACSGAQPGPRKQRCRAEAVEKTHTRYVKGLRDGLRQQGNGIDIVDTFLKAVGESAQVLAARALEVPR